MMIETIWNSDKFAADPRPDWVKAIQKDHKVTAYPDGDRWYFEPTESADKRAVGYTVNIYKSGVKIPSIWNGEKWLDMRTPEGKELYFGTCPGAMPELGIKP